MARDCVVIIVCGKKKVGKTVETISEIYKYVNGEPGIKNGRKALIFDVNDEFSDYWYFGERHRIKALALKDIALFSNSNIVEARRIRPYHDDGTRMTTDDMSVALASILEHYRNGLLLVEDINKYTHDNMSVDLIGSLATVRHAGIDCIIHYQGVGRAGNPKILSNSNYIRLHKTNDSVTRHLTKFEEKGELLIIAEKIVNDRYEKGDIRFSLYVDVDESKIVCGNGKDKQFDEKEIQWAISNYISENYRKLIKPLINQRTPTGEKVFKDEPSAYTDLLNSLRKKYFNV